jgi:magnesium chelatase family protein
VPVADADRTSDAAGQDSASLVHPEPAGTAAAPPPDHAERNRAFGRALLGLEAPAVTVETHLPGGLPGFTLVGLPEIAVREARDRVKSAIQNCGLDFPQGRVVVNLAPADLVKEGARFDLAIAVSILCATGQVPHQRAAEFEFLGELGLFGELRRVRGCLCAAFALRQTGARRQLVIPAGNAAEAVLCQGDPMLPLAHLQDVVALLRSGAVASATVPVATAPAAVVADPERLDDVIGQHAAKRALGIAAAGGHHLLMVGPPGTGKTMLARRLRALLPPLVDETAMEVAAVYSAAGLAPPAGGSPPFRDPHHSASGPALAGGGNPAMPGEISLAHGGVLFLDELPHFRPGVLNLLREPLEARAITIVRARYRTRFPARFQLIAAMNPCPAGRVCARDTCRCTPDQVRRYQARISGPLLDRIDLHVAVPPVPRELLLAGPQRSDRGNAGDVAPVSPTVATAAAHARQRTRQGCLNAELPGSAVLAHAALDTAGRTLLAQAVGQFGLSARSTHRILRTARTIADMAAEERVLHAHLGEALSYRALDWDRGLGMSAW